MALVTVASSALTFASALALALLLAGPGRAMDEPTSHDLSPMQGLPNPMQGRTPRCPSCVPRAAARPPARLRDSGSQSRRRPCSPAGGWTGFADPRAAPLRQRAHPPRGRFRLPKGSAPIPRGPVREDRARGRALPAGRRGALKTSRGVSPTASRRRETRSSSCPRGGSRCGRRRRTPADFPDLAAPARPFLLPRCGARLGPAAPRRRAFVRAHSAPGRVSCRRRQPRRLSGAAPWQRGEPASPLLTPACDTSVDRIPHLRRLLSARAVQLRDGPARDSQTLPRVRRATARDPEPRRP